jgi:hypothetical protein
MKDKLLKGLNWLMGVCIVIGLATLVYWGYYFLLTGWKLIFTTK